MTAGMILLSHTGEVEIPELVFKIETDEQGTVSDGDISGHKLSFSMNGKSERHDEAVDKGTADY